MKNFKSIYEIVLGRNLAIPTETVFPPLENTIHTRKSLKILRYQAVKASSHLRRYRIYFRRYYFTVKKIVTLKN